MFLEPLQRKHKYTHYSRHLDLYSTKFETKALSWEALTWRYKKQMHVGFL